MTLIFDTAALRAAIRKTRFRCAGAWEIPGETFVRALSPGHIPEPMQLMRHSFLFGDPD